MSLSLPHYPPMFWVTAVLAIVLIGVAKAGFGGGVGVIATPLMALTISVTDAAALLLPLLIIADIFSLRHYWHTYDRPSIQRMLPGAIVGILLGALFFGYFSDNERVLKVGIGVLALAFVAYQAGRSLLLGALTKTQPPAIAGVFLGAAAGFTSTLAHAGGPPATIYLLPQRLPRDIFVGTNVIFFSALNLIKLIPYAYLGLLRVGNLTTILILSPLAYLGVRLGVYLNRRFSDRWFNRLVYTLLFLTGVQLILGRNLLDLLLQWG
ncbi:sulfite exporter TauE/SafE family protein [Litorilinea aerophila]|uniref:sulfite exporter TauE/SafE family protein n=1 Tax=Litorilinea aerophila TaxID=1204385 RepID=UPI001E5E908C|nr:sulfite exporter TauE/SafE family protein [Litorilinea aerophila]MCC9077968.1 sulfite exporter TauE/SafE family protein [Litorilinea aerophila]